MTSPLRRPATPKHSAPFRLWVGLVVLALLYWGALAMHPTAMLALGVHRIGDWFLDLFAILASNDALARGLDIYAPNPLDPLNRPHVYSHWWLALGKFHLTRADNLWLGLTLVAVFFVAVVKPLRPRTRGEMCWYLSVLASSPVLLAVERANNDLVIFLVLAPVVPCLLSAGVGRQFLAGGLIALAAGLKFYPAVAVLLLLAPGEPRARRWRLLIGGSALAAVAMNVLPDFIRVQPLLPRADGLMTFGASNLLTWLGLHGAWAQLVACAVGLLVIYSWLRADMFSRWEIPMASRASWLQFVLGAVLLTACFFGGTSYAYRWIFALWLAPWLWQLGHDRSAPPAARRLAWATGALLLAALWIDPLAALLLVNLGGYWSSDQVGWIAKRVFAAEQPLTWALFVCLLGFITQFARDGLRSLKGGK